MRQVVSTLLMSIATLSSMSVTDACENWLESRRHHISPRTFQDYSYYIKTIAPFFQGLLVKDIDGDTLRRYQHDRSQFAGPETINKELGVIIQVRKRINRPIEDYQRLQQKKDYETVGRALTPSEETVFERVCISAADHRKWDVAALCSLLSMKTGMGPGEILSLKIKDVMLGSPSYVIVPRRGAKRIRRERTVVLVDHAEWAAQKLIERAREKCGSFLPDHYLIPYMRKDRSFDATRPARGYRSGMEHLLSLCETQFRRYDLRHHAISKALGNPKVSITSAELHFGHITQRMKNRYYHGDLDTLKVVAEAIAAKREEKKQPSFAQLPPTGTPLGRLKG
jgi:integrase